MGKSVHSRIHQVGANNQFVIKLFFSSTELNSYSLLSNIDAKYCAEVNVETLGIM